MSQNSTLPVKRLYIIISVLVAVHTAACFISVPVLWGADSWRFFPIYIQFLFVIFPFLLLIPAVQKFFISQSFDIISEIRTITSRLDKKDRYFLGSLGIISVYGLFWFLRSRTHFLGDGILRIRSIDYGQKFSLEQPLDIYLHAKFLQLFKWIPGWSAEDSFIHISIICGILFIMMCWRFVNRFFDTDDKKFFFFMGLAGMGSVQFFFGYVENYICLTLLVLIYYYYAFRVLRENFSVVPAVFVFSFAICFHVSACIFLLPLVYLIFWKIKNASLSLRQALEIIFAFLIPIVLLLFLFWSEGESLGSFSSQFIDKGHILPIFTPVERIETTYHFFSGYHFLDILNELFLTVPILFFYIILCMDKKKTFQITGERNFILLAVISCFFFLFFFDPEKGYSRDWDLFAIISIPLTVYCGLSIMYKYSNTITRIGVIFGGYLLVHTGSWVMVNAYESYGLQRFSYLAESRWWSNRATGDAFDEIRNYYLVKGEYEQSIRYALKSYFAVPSRRYKGNVSGVYFKYAIKLEKESNTAKAEEFYRKALEYNPKHAASMNNLGKLLEKRGEIETALKLYDMAVAVNPLFSIPYINLGAYYFNNSEYNKANEYFERAVQIEPENPDFYYNLGLSYRLSGNLQKALEAFQKSLDYGLTDIYVYNHIFEINALLKEKKEKVKRQEIEVKN